jgi:hypothetical protein
MATFRKRGNKWQVQVRRKNQPSISRSFNQKFDAQCWARDMECSADAPYVKRRGGGWYRDAIAMIL